MAIHRGYGAGQRTQALPERTLGDLLNESFAVYWKHVWRFVALAAVVYVPLTAVTGFMGYGVVAYVVGGLLMLMGSITVYGAICFAVGQQYLTGEISIRACYSRVRWRMMSIGLLVVILALAISLGVVLAFLVVPLIILLAYMVYWSVVVPAVIVEGHRAVAALKRSFGLVRGSWWRVFGITLVVLLVAVGLGLVVASPFALVSRMVAPSGPTTLSETVVWISRAVVLVAVQPVLSIVGTLLYYDLRVRKEEYDLTSLSREMGLTGA